MKIETKIYRDIRNVPIQKVSSSLFNGINLRHGINEWYYQGAKSVILTYKQNILNGITVNLIL